MSPTKAPSQACGSVSSDCNQAVARLPVSYVLIPNPRCNAETQDVYSDGSSPHKSMVSDEPDEVFGDSIDEDSQAVRHPQSPSALAPSTSGKHPQLSEL